MLNFIFFKVKQKIDTYTNARTDSPTIGYAEKFGINLDIFFYDGIPSASKFTSSIVHGAVLIQHAAFDRTQL